MSNDILKKIDVNTSILMGIYKTSRDTKKKAKVGLALSLLALIAELDDEDTAQKMIGRVKKISGII